MFRHSQNPCCNCPYRSSGKTDELVAVLEAISNTSRRLAQKLAAMEYREAEKRGGRDRYEETSGNRRDCR